MNETFTRELVRRMAPHLKAQFYLHQTLPLEIKLRLERLKLAERVHRAVGIDSEPKAVASWVIERTDRR
jgi:hypothetical protein